MGGPRFSEAASPTPFRHSHLGFERIGGSSSIRRHRHEYAYIAVVLSGSYVEAGFGPRISARAGDVIVHPAFDAHLDEIGNAGAHVLNLPLPAGLRLPRAFRIRSVDEVAQLAERDLVAAARAVHPAGDADRQMDWPDLLAGAILTDTSLELRQWAGTHGLAPETLSRGFRKVFGVSPSRFRAEARACRALGMIARQGLNLARIANECGFADQPHFNRAIRSLTGLSPGAIRRVNLVQDGS